MDIWDHKQENGMNVTENKLYEAMKRRGLNPIPQYKIDQMTVDFFFPEHNHVVEVHGPHHDLPEYQDKDAGRFCLLANKFGCTVQEIPAELVHDDADFIAKDIEESLKPTVRTSDYRNYESGLSNWLFPGLTKSLFQGLTTAEVVVIIILLAGILFWFSVSFLLPFLHLL